MIYGPILALLQYTNLYVVILNSWFLGVGKILGGGEANAPPPCSYGHDFIAYTSRGLRAGIRQYATILLPCYRDFIDSVWGRAMPSSFAVVA